jgi:SOS-response transcriptional repressor LexA
MTRDRKIVPIVAAEIAEAGACDGAEPFALMVLGDSMLPEFAEGEIIVIEPAGLARDGSFVVAMMGGEPVLRQLIECGSGWLLHPLDPRYADAAIADLSVVRGVVIQKSRPGSRRSRKSYVD